MSIDPFRCGSLGEPVTRTSACNVPLTFVTWGTKPSINPRLERAARDRDVELLAGARRHVLVGRASGGRRRVGRL